MSTSPQLNKRIQRAPPNIFHLPDMFRGIAESLRRSFRRARAKRRQGTRSILAVPIYSTTPCSPIADRLAGKQSHPIPKQGPVSPYNSDLGHLSSSESVGSKPSLMASGSQYRYRFTSAPTDAPQLPPYELMPSMLDSSIY